MSTLLITQAIILNEGQQTNGSMLIQDDHIAKIIPRGGSLPKRQIG